MKHFSLICLAALSLLFVSCNKDSSDNSTGTFTFNEKAYTLSRALNLDYGSIATGKYKYQIELLSSGLKYSESTSDLSGKGERISITIISDQAKFPAAGTYTLNPTTEYVVGTIDQGAIYLNYAGDTGAFDYKNTVSGGSLTLNKDGDTYTITMDMTLLVGGKTLTGSYTGSIAYIDWKKK